MRLWEIVENAAEAVPTSTALVAAGHRWSFADLRSEIDRQSAGLRTIVRSGERVAIIAENSPAYVTALYAVPRAGSVLVHGNTRHTSDELAHMLRRCDAAVLMGTTDQLERLAAHDLPAIRHRICLDGDLEGAMGLDELVSGAGAVPGPSGPEASRVAESAMAWLLYTSGTTGRAKGAMLTHRSLIAAALNTTMSRPVASDEVYLFPFPLFHVAAYNVLHHHLRRRPVVLLPRFDTAEVLDAIENELVTSVSLAPTMLAMLLDDPGRADHDLTSLRTVSYGAAAMPLDLLRRSLRELPHVGLAQGYGMTELSGNAVFLSPEDHRRAATDDPALLSAAGRPAPMTALRIIDDDGGRVEPGGPGEILVRGDQVCAGYFEDPAATAAAIVDGWLHTGDVGRIDERGYLHVLDRKKDIIITGGENVSSREVEDAIGTHPSVRAVAVVAAADERWGEVVVAVVVPEPSPTDDPGAPSATGPTVGDLREACSTSPGSSTRGPSCSCRNFPRMPPARSTRSRCALCWTTAPAEPRPRAARSARGQIPDRLALVDAEGEDRQSRGRHAGIHVAVDVLAALLRRSVNDQLVDQ